MLHVVRCRCSPDFVALTVAAIAGHGSATSAWDNHLRLVAARPLNFCLITARQQPSSSFGQASDDHRLDRSGASLLPARRRERPNKWLLYDQTGTQALALLDAMRNSRCLMQTAADRGQSEGLFL